MRGTEDDVSGVPNGLRRLTEDNIILFQVVTFPPTGERGTIMYIYRNRDRKVYRIAVQFNAGELAFFGLDDLAVGPDD